MPPEERANSGSQKVPDESRRDERGKGKESNISCHKQTRRRRTRRCLAPEQSPRAPVRGSKACCNRKGERKGGRGNPRHVIGASAERAPALTQAARLLSTLPGSPPSQERSGPKAWGLLSSARRLPAAPTASPQLQWRPPPQLQHLRSALGRQPCWPQRRPRLRYGGLRRRCGLRKCGAAGIRWRNGRGA